MRVMTPRGVMQAMRGIEPNTSEWKQQRDAIRLELLEVQRLDPVGVGCGSKTWTAMLSLLQLDVIELKSKEMI